jgi:hypothetical protein
VQRPTLAEAGHALDADLRPLLELGDCPGPGIGEGRAHPGDDLVPATFYWGTGRRTWSSDPRQDEAICILEAAAQSALSAKAQKDGAGFAAARRLLDEGSRSSEGPIRWTATRLLDALAH